MSNTCKAAVWVKKGQIDVMDVQMPECADDGMIIKVEAASVCGTDLHLFETEPRGSDDTGGTRCAGAWWRWAKTPPKLCAVTPER